MTMQKQALENEDFLLQSRWSVEKIQEWYSGKPWPVGCNYIPSNAINQLEMWQAESFDALLIDKELSWAAALGFNTVRVFLHHLVWEEDSKGYLERLEKFLSIAQKHGISAMLVLFDAVWNPFPQAGKQPAPKNLVHNSGWVQCPGYHILNDAGKHDPLKQYVSGIVRHFKNDERVLAWDVFNEPDNMNLASYKDTDYVLHKAELAMQLLKKALVWIRQINPVQPITMAPWQFETGCHNRLSSLDQYMFTHSDIISFHCYEDKTGMGQRISDLKRYNRPLLCTEYMARPLKSTFGDILPLLKENGVGAYSWGLVAGKSQTHCPWDSWEQPYAAEPTIWFHDVLRADGRPYNEAEAAFLKQINGRLPG